MKFECKWDVRLDITTLTKEAITTIIHFIYLQCTSNFDLQLQSLNILMQQKMCPKNGIGSFEFVVVCLIAAPHCQCICSRR